MAEISNHAPTVGRTEARTAGTWRDEIRADYAGGKAGYRRRVRRMGKRQMRATDPDEI
jgi:hypothetical protein